MKRKQIIGNIKNIMEKWFYNEQETDSLLNSKANVNHTHVDGGSGIDVFLKFDEEIGILSLIENDYYVTLEAEPPVAEYGDTSIITATVMNCDDPVVGASVKFADETISTNEEGKAEYVVKLNHTGHQIVNVITKINETILGEIHEKIFNQSISVQVNKKQYNNVIMSSENEDINIGESAALKVNIGESDKGVLVKLGKQSAHTNEEGEVEFTVKPDRLGDTEYVAEIPRSLNIHEAESNKVIIHVSKIPVSISASVLEQFIPKGSKPIVEGAVTPLSSDYPIAGEVGLTSNKTEFIVNVSEDGSFTAELPYEEFRACTYPIKIKYLGNEYHDESTTVSRSVTIIDRYTVYITTNKSTLDLNESTTITAKVLGDGTPLEGEEVVFSTDNGNLSNTEAITNADGECTVTYSSSSIGDKNITASSHDANSNNLIITVQDKSGCE